ncbi:Hypothetical protein SMAX5B_006802 [Scophthalmus maximus]|uniref:Uncharacterized protein n=1 Tax=Scophthalmus maximus TaxID=52904 RepID=A0A2U9B804_SCOMX|nr:Hypothetical protein SMAX5B_006802 [Scophthalmus maximus]
MGRLNIFKRPDNLSCSVGEIMGQMYGCIEYKEGREDTEEQDESEKEGWGAAKEAAEIEIRQECQIKKSQLERSVKRKDCVVNI